MAKRRMFSLDVVDTDSFLDLPASSQSLYFHLGMRADDDSFVSSPKRITAMVGAAGDDLKLLIAKGFVIPFESGVCVIRDWRVNNYIQRDRYTPSIYTEEKQRLSIAENGRYSHVDTQCIQDVSKSDTQVRIDIGGCHQGTGHTVQVDTLVPLIDMKGIQIRRLPVRAHQPGLDLQSPSQLRRQCFPAFRSSAQDPQACLRG